MAGNPWSVDLLASDSKRIFIEASGLHGCTAAAGKMVVVNLNHTDEESLRIRIKRRY